MAYYDTSDTMYSFQNLKRERQEEEEKYAKRAQYAAKGAANLWKMYSSDQKLKTKELLGCLQNLIKKHTQEIFLI